MYEEEQKCKILAEEDETFLDVTDHFFQELFGKCVCVLSVLVFVWLMFVFVIGIVVLSVCLFCISVCVCAIAYPVLSRVMRHN